MNGKILIAEDDSTSREMLLKLLSQAGYAVVPSVDGEDALEKITDETSVAIVDLRMPKLSGFACLEEIRKNQPNTPVIVVSAAGTKDAVQAMQKGAFSFLQKPFNRSEILESVAEAINAKAERDKEVERNTPLRALLPGSRSVQFEEKFRDQIESIEATDKPLLLIGERGSPIRELTRYLYERLLKKEKPFVEIDLNSLSVNQAYRELFGSSEEKGKYNYARGGVLFLRGVEKLSLRIQAEILKRRRESIDELFLICSTTADPQALCEHGFLDSAFLELISAQTATLPPLRERRGDIPALVSQFLEHLGNVCGGASITLEQEALNKLIEHDWPGNEEHLERVLERACFLATEGIVRVSDLLLEEIGAFGNDSTIIELADRSLCDIENYFIEWQLRKHNGNKSKAARSLGITDRTIFNRVQKYGLG